MTLFVVGNVTEDIVFSLPNLPSDGETLIAESRISDIGGKGLNQALIAGRSGMEVALIAPIGHDEAGLRARALVAEERFDALLIEKDGPTDQSIIAVAHSGENHIISSAFAASALTAEDVFSATNNAGTGDHILMQGNLSFGTTHAVLRWARNKGIETTVNPSPIRWDYGPLWYLIDRVILNKHELATLSNKVDLDQGIETLAAKGVREVVVTQGAHGSVYSDGTVRHKVAASPAKVVDTAGAGDTFCGVYIAGLERGHGPITAMEIAAHAAAITIGRRGTWSAFPSTEELADLFRAAEAEMAK